MPRWLLPGILYLNQEKILLISRANRICMLKQLLVELDNQDKIIQVWVLKAKFQGLRGLLTSRFWKCITKYKMVKCLRSLKVWVKELINTMTLMETQLSTKRVELLSNQLLDLLSKQKM
jgi:hypothetical protein